MEPIRPSILHRRPRSASQCTLETTEEQYRREQELLAAKSKRLQTAEERLLSSLYPDAQHVRARQHEILQLQEQHLAAQAEARQREAQLEAQYSQRSRGAAGNQPSGTARPWATATLSFASDEQEREARKQFAAEVAAENLALMAARAQQRQQQQCEELKTERQIIASETQYWNLGASGRRWIAPEHRHLAPSPPQAQASTAAAAAVVPPWAVHDGSGSAAANQAGGLVHDVAHGQRRHVTVPKSQPLTKVRHPWEWVER